MSSQADPTMQIADLTEELASARATLARGLATLNATNKLVTAMEENLAAQSRLVGTLLARLSEAEFQALPADVRAVAARFRTLH